MTTTALRTQLQAQGFDRAYISPPREGRGVTARCSQCEASVINGSACHETGCPNQVFECRGCNAQVSRSGAYCEDCS